MNVNRELSATFGKVMESHRRRLGIAQDKLALEAGLDRTFVGRLARGKLNPSLESIFRLSNALGIEPEELIRQVREELRSPGADLDARD